jgi:hypothetical protein
MYTRTHVQLQAMRDAWGDDDDEDDDDDKQEIKPTPPREPRVKQTYVKPSQPSRQREGGKLSPKQGGVRGGDGHDDDDKEEAKSSTPPQKNQPRVKQSYIKPSQPSKERVAKVSAKSGVVDDDGRVQSPKIAEEQLL